MSRLAVGLLLGIIVGGLAVQAGVFSPDVSADRLCTQQLDGDGWEANLTASTELDDGARLVCENGDRTETITVDVNVEVGSG